MSEIYMEGRFKMPVIDTDDLGYGEDEVKKFDWEEFAKYEFWNSCEGMGELEDKYDITFHKIQPQLTIPESVADEIKEKDLDDYGIFQTLAQKSQIISDHEPFCDLSDGFISWCEDNEKWWAIMNAYLAGKALGVDLVKVVEK